MAAQRAAIKALLTADSAWNALVTGGTYLRDDLGRLGLTPETAQYDTVTHLLKPTAVLVFSTASQKEIVSISGRRFFQIYFYADSGYALIEQMKNKAVKLLHQKRTVADDTGLNAICWIDDSREFIADELQGAAAMFSRFFVDYTRK